MTYYPWRKRKFVLEIAVSGPIRDAWLMHQIEKAVRTRLYEIEKASYSTPEAVTKFGNPILKRLSRVLSAERVKERKAKETS